MPITYTSIASQDNNSALELERKSKYGPRTKYITDRGYHLKESYVKDSAIITQITHTKEKLQIYLPNHWKSKNPNI